MSGQVTSINTYLRSIIKCSSLLWNSDPTGNFETL